MPIVRPLIPFVSFLFVCCAFSAPVKAVAIERQTIEYPYAPYNQRAMDPQLTGWPLTEAERAYAVQAEHERRPGREANRHIPAMWPVTPSAGFWGGTSWLDTHSKLVHYVQANPGPCDVLLVGDSITQQLGSPLDKAVLNEAWKKHFDTYNADGTLINELYLPDNIHLSAVGYSVYAERLKPLLNKCLGAQEPQRGD